MKIEGAPFLRADVTRQNALDLTKAACEASARRMPVFGGQTQFLAPYFFANLLCGQARAAAAYDRATRYNVGLRDSHVQPRGPDLQPAYLVAHAMAGEDRAEAAAARFTGGWHEGFDLQFLATRLVAQALSDGESADRAYGETIASLGSLAVESRLRSHLSGAHLLSSVLFGAEKTRAAAIFTGLSDFAESIPHYMGPAYLLVHASMGEERARELLAVAQSEVDAVFFPYPSYQLARPGFMLALAISQG
jgi:hypothetical protein